jgi:cyclic pyranopterin phosphate synthase
MTPVPITDSLGRALRDLRISVTDRCNFRCPYCMPAEVFGDSYEFLAKREILTFEEIERLTRVFVRLGARKLRVTGGEPLVRRELPELIRKLARIEGVEDLALTTNGYTLAEHADALARAGLRRVTVSLDSLDEDAFRRLSGRDFGPQPVLAGIAAAERAGLVPIKINCVVVRGVNEAAILDLVRHFRGTGHVVRFIEYMDVGTLNGWRREDVVGAKEILERLRTEFSLAPVDASYPGEVATRYRHVDGSGEIGIIASVTMPFCRGCTRARLSADGRLITCLFAAEGLDLKTPMRAGAGDDELAALIADRWSRRDDRYSELRARNARPQQSQQHLDKVEMFEVGG